MHLAKLALELLPGEGVVILGLLRSHLALQPLLQTQEVNVLHGPGTLAGLDLRVVVCFRINPAEPTHVVFLVLGNGLDLLDFCELGGHVFFGVEEFVVCSEFLHFELHTTQLDNVMLLNGIAFLFQRANH